MGMGMGMVAHRDHLLNMVHLYCSYCEAEQSWINER